MAVLAAIQELGDALDHTHSDLRHRMAMNSSDLAALRMLVIRERHGEPVTPQEIAEHLGISTASATTLLHRLTARGHIQREHHPQDGRSRVVTLTDKARAEFFAQFREQLGTMRELVQSYPAEQRRTIARFLEDLSEALQRGDARHPDGPRSDDPSPDGPSPDGPSTNGPSTDGRSTDAPTTDESPTPHRRTPS